MALIKKMLEKVAQDIKLVKQNGIQICVVIGGGNIYRGVQAVAHHNMDRTISDQMGMLATIINGLALQNALENEGVICSLLSAIPIPSISEAFSRRRALQHMDEGRLLSAWQAVATLILPQIPLQHCGPAN